MGMMLDYIGEAAMYEQIAEEAAEFAQSALKKARILRGENPTPVSNEVADTNVREEFTDLILCAMELGISPDPTLIYGKQKRFIDRVNAAERQRVVWVKERGDFHEANKHSGSEAGTGRN